MTKRFTSNNGVFYVDNETGWEFQCYGEVVHLMNNLAEENDKEYWDILRDMQYNCDGYYSNHKTIFDYEKQFWEKHRDELKEKRLQTRMEQLE